MYLFFVLCKLLSNFVSNLAYYFYTIIDYRSSKTHYMYNIIYMADDMIFKKMSTKSSLHNV